MKIKELIYQTPEMSEEKLLEIMDKNLEMVPSIIKQRIISIHFENTSALPISRYILKEYDLIQDKKSFLTKSQRDSIIGFVGMCLIKMTKND